MFDLPQEVLDFLYCVFLVNLTAQALLHYMPAFTHSHTLVVVTTL